MFGYTNSCFVFDPGFPSSGGECDERHYFHLEKDPKRGLINVDNPYITLLQSAAVLDDDGNTDKLMCTLTRLGFSG
jgi:hypothetical protein